MPLALIENLVSKVTGLPLGTWDTVNEAIEAMEGIASNQDLQANWTTIFHDLGVPDASGAAAYWIGLSNAIQEAGTGNWTDLLGYLGLGDIPGLAAWLNTAASGLMATQISSSAITADNAQLLDNPNFSGAISVNGNGIWTWDSSVYYVPPGTTVTDPGSAMLTVNGVLQQVQSNPSKQIPLGQPIVCSTRVLTQGLTGNGMLLQLVVVPWIGNIAQTPVVVAQSGAPTGPTTGWTNAPSGSAAGLLSGTYKPATDSGITNISTRLVVTGAATAGTVRFSAASVELTGGLIADLQNESTAQQQAWATLWNSWWTTATTPNLTFAQKISQIDAALATYQATNANINAAQTATLTQLIAALFNIDTTTGQMAALNVASSTGAASLQDDLTGVNSDINGMLAALAAGDSAAFQTNMANLLSLFGIHPSDVNGTVNVNTVLTNWINSLLSPLNLLASTSTTNNLSTVQAQIGQIFNGQAVTAFNTEVQQVKDWWTAVTGDGATGTISPNALNAQVPPASVGGSQGIVSMDQTVLHTWDSIATSIANIFGWNVAGAGNSLATAANILQQHAQATSTALSLGTDASNALNQMAANQPSFVNVFGAAASNMPVPSMNCQLPISLAFGKSTIGFIRCTQAATFGAVTFFAYYNTSSPPTTIYLNLYKLDQSTGALDFLYSSSNIFSSITGFASSNPPTTGIPWVTYTLPGANQVSVQAGDIIAVEIQNASTGGSGLNVHGIPSPGTSIWYGIANRPGVPLANLGAARSPGTTKPAANIASSGFTFSGQYPFVSLESTSTPANYIPPETQYFTTSQTVTAPSWANAVDVIAVGGGGSGGNGFGFPGNNGSPTTVTSGSNSLTAAGGTAGSSGTSNLPAYGTGLGPGNETFDGFRYTGGTDVAAQSPGSPPGGGGGGGHNFGAATYGQGGSGGAYSAATWNITPGASIVLNIGAGGLAPGGGFGAAAGASGEVWIVFKQ